MRTHGRILAILALGVGGWFLIGPTAAQQPPNNSNNNSQTPPNNAQPNAPASGQESRQPAYLGVTMFPLTADVKSRLNVKGDAGVVVMNVMPSSPAANAGLRQGDVITAINDKPVRDPDQMREV